MTLGGGARGNAGSLDPWAKRRERMIDLLVSRGIRDERVIEAMRRIPRHEFVPEPFTSKAYGDHALSIGTEVGLPGIVRDLGLVAVTIASLTITPATVHADNQFSWAPMQEVAKLFAGIFLTIIPVIAMLRAGVDGPFGAVIAAVTRPDGSPNPAMYFWATGALSSFLDNAPTYLVFFNTAGGDAATLMTRDASTLAAISTGAVFIGANTYIGNAPNLMVKAIAENRGVRMPSFFGYMLYSGIFLMPLFVIMTFLFFHV